MDDRSSWNYEQHNKPSCSMDKPRDLSKSLCLSEEERNIHEAYDGADL